jgi:hypothetical protein
MATEIVPDQIWGNIASEVAQRFGLTTLRSRTLARVIEFGVHYVDADSSAGQIVFDTRALFIGFILAGSQSPQMIRYGNTATWFVEWLQQQTSAQALTDVISRVPVPSPSAIGILSRMKASVTLSSSVTSMRDRAVAIATATIGQPEYEARHLFAAMIEKGAIEDQAQLLFKIKLTSDSLIEFKNIFVDAIMLTAAEGERASSWEKILKLPNTRKPTPPATETSAPAGTTPSSAGPPSAPPEPPRILIRPKPVDTVTVFGRDGIAPADGPDPLDTAGDARALARLICLRDAAPLAIAIFGGWGSGKSTFIERLDQEVTAISGSARTPSADPPQPQPFVGRVVQIRFNAWQFVDANLWASLAVEFFEQLRAGGWDRAGASRHAHLVERVNSHVPALNEAVEEKRQAAAASGKVLAMAQDAHDQAVKVSALAPFKAVSEQVAVKIGDVYEAQKGQLDKLGLGATAKDVDKSVDAILAATRATGSILGQLAAVVRVILKSSFLIRAAGIVAIGAVVGIVAVIAWTIWGHPWDNLQAVLSTGASSIVALGVSAAAIRPALSFVHAIAKHAGGLTEAVENAEGAATRARLRAELDLRRAKDDAEKTQREAEEAASEQRRYVGPDGATGQPRLLKYLLEADPETKALAAEIGVIGRARRLFQAVDDIVRQEARKPPGEQLDGDVPERIVLYIDDLDRCTVDQVYNVLQAVHLLLAFDLFVVVVGVDVAWVQDALNQAFDDDGKDPVAQRRRAARYLDKIFQIAFWLSPLSSDGENGGSFARYVRELSHRKTPPVGTPPPPAKNVPAVPPPGAPPATATPEQPAEVNAAPAPTPAAATQADTVAPANGPAVAPASLASIELQEIEIEFLASATIAGVAATTPRAVKRLINVYRLVRTRLAESGALDPVGGGGGPPDYPLIGLMVAIETGQPGEVADMLLAGLKQLAPAQPLIQDAFFEGPTENDTGAMASLRKAFAACPNLEAAFGTVAALRNNDLTAGDALRVARLARRYSFNPYS